MILPVTLKLNVTATENKKTLFVAFLDSVAFNNQGTEFIADEGFDATKPQRVFHEHTRCDFPVRQKTALKRSVINTLAESVRDKSNLSMPTDKTKSGNKESRKNKCRINGHCKENQPEIQPVSGKGRKSVRLLIR